MSVSRYEFRPDQPRLQFVRQRHPQVRDERHADRRRERLRERPQIRERFARVQARAADVVVLLHRFECRQRPRRVAGSLAALGFLGDVAAGFVGFAVDAATADPRRCARSRTRGRRCALWLSIGRRAPEPAGATRAAWRPRLRRAQRARGASISSERAQAPAGRARSRRGDRVARSSTQATQQARQHVRFGIRSAPRQERSALSAACRSVAPSSHRPRREGEPNTCISTTRPSAM